MELKQNPEMFSFLRSQGSRGQVLRLHSSGTVDQSSSLLVLCTFQGALGMGYPSVSRSISNEDTGSLLPLNPFAPLLSDLILSLYLSLYALVYPILDKRENIDHQTGNCRFH